MSKVIPLDRPIVNALNSYAYNAFTLSLQYWWLNAQLLLCPAYYQWAYNKFCTELAICKGQTTIWEINFSEILIKIHTFSFKKMWLKMSSAKSAAIYELIRHGKSLPPIVNNFLYKINHAATEHQNMVLIVQDKWVPIFHEERFQLPVPTHHQYHQ